MRPLDLVAAACTMLASFYFCAADTPAHCLYNQTMGEWTFFLSTNTGNNTISCPADQQAIKVTKTFTVNLTEPDVAILSDGTLGFWTMLYDEGFHVVVGGQKFFAFQNYTVSSDGNATSYCGLTNTGFFHDAPSQVGVVPSNWGCYYGVKAKDAAVNVQRLPMRVQADEHAVFVNDAAFAGVINSEQKLWTATPNHAFSGMPIKTGLKRMGKYVYNTPMAVKPQVATRPALSATQRLRLPDSFDWRDAQGGNFVCPVRDQGQCGSCYSFGSTGSLCSRSNVVTKGAAASQFWSPQTVVSCSPYSQGCDGGFSYNVFKYGEDFGIPWDTCFPYEDNGDVPACSNKCTDPTQYNYVTDYQFVGGFYGAATPELMMQEIFDNGPISVEFFVYSDFMQYKGGVYVHTQAAENQAGLNPWEATNHEVQMIGWGVDSGTPYWICQNSWGTSWGEEGYFRILRGKDECAIESIPAAGTPVLQA